MNLREGDSILHTPDGDIGLVVGISGLDNRFCMVKGASDGLHGSYSKADFIKYWKLGDLAFSKQTLISRYVEATREKL
jgi:hypothetical protein